MKNYVDKIKKLIRYCYKYDYMLQFYNINESWAVAMNGDKAVILRYSGGKWSS